MKTYRMSIADSLKHKPENPERTAHRTCAWDVEYKVWPSRGALMTTIKMQEKIAFNYRMWIPCVKELETQP